MYEPEKKIYLSGAITGIPEAEAWEWRENIKDTFEDFPKIQFFNPVSHFTELSVKVGAMDDCEIMRIELDKLRDADMVFYNCHHPYSLGSMAELAIAYEHRIPILAFNETEEELHPWIECMCTKIFKSKDDMVGFFINHYLYY